MKKCFVLIVFIFFFVKALKAQTINRGIIYVSPNTALSFTKDFNNTVNGEFWNNGNVYSYANWNNDGIVDFSIFNINSGLTSFIGSDTQIISGSNVNYMYNSFFDNASGMLAFNLQGDLSITNASDFTLGIIDNKLSNGMFIFERNANFIGASNNSHVNGGVIKIGDTPFSYPIGNGDYFRSASISNPSLNNDVFIGEYFFETTNSNYPVNNLDSNLVLVDNTEYWVIERSTGISNVSITLTWNNETTPVEILAGDLESIHIALWDENLQLWIDQGGIQDIGNQSVSALVENYGVFTLARAKENLVIDFNPFLTPNGDGVNDTWNINHSDDIEIITIHIFDRYGKLLRLLTPNSIGWDGTYNGNRLPGTDYWFVAEYKDLRDNTIHQIKSHIALKY